MSPGERRSAIATRSIHIRARLFVAVLHVAVRVLSKHDDLLSTHAEGPLGIRMQGALNAVDVRENDVRAPSVRSYEDPVDLAKMLDDGADVGLDGVWR
jgi:hypothetical protein